MSGFGVRALRAGLGVAVVLLLLGLSGATPSLLADQEDSEAWRGPGAGSSSSSLSSSSGLGSPREEARAELRQVMKDPLFSRWRLRQKRQEGTKEKNAWLDLSPYVEKAEEQARRVKEWIRETWDWIFGNAPTVPSAPSTAGWSGFKLAGFMKILGWVVFVIAGGVILWMLYSLLSQRAKFVASGGSGRVELTRALEEGEALAASSQQWLDHADDLAVGEDLRRAFRAMYLALLSGLHGSGRIQFRKQRTNWAYVSGYRGPDEERSLFRGLTTWFDDVWYGLHMPRPEVFREVSGQVQKLLSQAKKDEDRPGQAVSAVPRSRSEPAASGGAAGGGDGVDRRRGRGLNKDSGGDALRKRP